MNQYLKESIILVLSEDDWQTVSQISSRVLADRKSVATTVNRLYAVGRIERRECVAINRKFEYRLLPESEVSGE